MRHVNYMRWAMYIIELFKFAEGKRVERVLELACGTGNMLVEMSRAGYEVCGLDLSFDMVRQAASRLSKGQTANGKQQNHHSPFALHLLPIGPRVWCGDMQNVAVTSPVDVMLCLYDSFNYCVEPAGARRLLQNAAGAVRPGGLFIFDVCTEHNCRKNFNNFYEREGYLEVSYIRRAHFKPYRKIQVNEFFITDVFSHGPTLYERHEQRIYSLPEIAEMIDPKEWTLVGVFDGMSQRPGSERSDRVHFVLRKL